jgi:signal transduction histidine kinase/ActR/RegA family two-component response regulator
MTVRKRAPRRERSSGTAQLSARIATLEQELGRVTQVRNALEAERDELADLYATAPLPALTLDVAYVVQRANHAAAHLLSEGLDSLAGRSFRSSVASGDRPAFAAALARASATGKLEKFRVSLELAPARAFPVQAWAVFSPLRHQYELRLLDLREQERAELEARRLVEAERVAREESAAKDKFIAVLSHELRTPLTPVLVAASALRAKAPPGPQRDTFEMIERNVTAEARLIDDLLDVNRIVRNKMQVSCRPCDVHSIAREALANVQPDVEAKKHATHVELSAHHHFANVDPLRLRQVFMNLLKNSIKFTPPGGRILLRSWDSGPNLAVEVEDTGVGIDHDAMSELFEPFTEDRSATLAGGLGLGLAISRGLVELQGGKIWAHSRGRDRGARFVVEVPALAQASAPAPVVEVKRSEPPPSSDRGDAPHILLVDDHEDTVQILSDLLTENGFFVETAGSVKAAQNVDLHAVDVIVSDIGLPDGSGFDLMRDLRSRTNRPAIALSGFGMESDVRAAEEAGFDLHLTKPVDIDRLLTAIEELSRKAAKIRAQEGSHHSAPSNP